MSEVLCKYCRQACWLTDSRCDKSYSEIKVGKEGENNDAFFYRLLLLDDMNQKTKEEREDRSHMSSFKDEERNDRKKFVFRKERHESPSSIAETSSTCYRCNEPVYQAEARMTMGKLFHAICFTCRACHRFLDAMNVTDGPDGDAYCYNCYKHKFLTDVNRPLGASKTNTIMAPEGDINRCLRCFGKVFQAERRMSSHGVYHKACFRCAEVECGRFLDSVSYCDSDTGKIFCPTCYNKVHGTKGSGPTLISNQGEQGEKSRNDSIGPRETSSVLETESVSLSPKCPKCYRAVYAPERVFVGRKVWHKTCLICQTCSRTLNSQLINEVADGELVYCPKCYRNNKGVVTTQHNFEKST
ncbi:muscle LIM protein Mlp84B isoform X2 [Eurytemora carolleeae]|uniref:muscle LIM protein Mlp84B isoform X2 n=1 Tax=Eurytemora carolleeae TaxID=1294199 RepID=UPI000C7622F2|nr:muscle LIM protein Mlp84B isoform X2 [Eurytemora carolleeae]|eukprot:XP_023347272.1 muscle LIM protein Mlp84B-like isoform X2 [Eurytemora affinis]